MDMQEQLRKIQEEATSQLESIRDKAGLDAPVSYTHLTLPTN